MGEDFIYQQISAAILEQRLAPGTRLTEETLSDIFGASRTIIRRVLSRLDHENTVEIRPNRGAIVACPTIDQAFAIFEARQIIEQATVRRCVEKHTPADIARLKGLLQAEKDAIARNDRTLWIRLTGDFHLEIARISANEIMTGFLKELICQTSLIIALYGTGGGSLCAGDDHARILKAINQNDPQGAVALMTAHLSECADTLNMAGRTASHDLKSVFSRL